MRNESLGERVRILREYFKLNQGQLSEEIGLVQSVISEVEKGKKEPSIRFLNAMALRFAVNQDWIMTGEGEMFISPEDYITRGIELLGAKTMSEGFLTALHEQRFAEFQAYLLMDKFKQEQSDGVFQELLQLVSRVWRQGDERTRKMLVQLVKVVAENEGE
jgi:transcriptional regulator with XRE-family HTH domain